MYTVAVCRERVDRAATHLRRGVLTVIEGLECDSLGHRRISTGEAARSREQGVGVDALRVIRVGEVAPEVRVGLDLADLSGYAQPLGGLPLLYAKPLAGDGLPPDSRMASAILL